MRKFQLVSEEVLIVPLINLGLFSREKFKSDHRGRWLVQTTKRWILTELKESPDSFNDSM